MKPISDASPDVRPARCHFPRIVRSPRRPVHHGGVRDDFPAAIKTELAKRVGFLCSNPACRQSTSGPQSAPRGTVNVGVAAHITAASPGGPRYEAGPSAQARSSASNGIWLCQTCAKLIDNDVPGHGADLLRRWKAEAEQAAAAALTRRRSPTVHLRGHIP